MDALLLNLGIFVVSLGVLLKASDWFIDAAERIGLSLGVPQFIIGVTIVSVGTSLPELATSIASIYIGKSEIVVGNVVGSNITNIALVLGLTAVYSKQISLDGKMWNGDLPFLFASAFLLYFVLLDLNFTLFEAILFLFGNVLFLAYSFSSGDEEEVIRPPLQAAVFLKLIAGGALVYFGASYTIYAISELSDIAGIDPDVIALTAVALGTSLPEVIVSLNAARKGKTSIAVGNVLGSNVFNTFAVMGVPRLFGPLVIPESVLNFSLPLMMVMTVLFGIMCVSSRITRWEGLVMLMFYAFFIVELFQNQM
ncbi:MAG: calcium/sodium antiporter [Saprospiraceae bacterium]